MRGIKITSENLGTLNCGEYLLYKYEEFGKEHTEIAKVTQVEEDFAIAQTDSGTNLYMDKDVLDKFENIELLQYIYDMPLRMAAADIVISRAGAITISELARQGKAAILIPSPNVTDDQQTKNAKALADIGGAIMIRETELAGGKICNSVASLLDDAERRAVMEKAIAGFAPLDSNKLIFDELLNLANKN